MPSPFPSRPGAFTRRQLLQALGAAAVVSPFSRALAQGRCIRALGTPPCDTTAIPPVFAPTGWRTVILDSITMRVADHRKEAAFYAALMGWKLRSDDGREAVMDIGDWGTMIFRADPALAALPAGGPAPADTGGGRGGRAGGAGARGGGGGRGGGAPPRAVVEGFCWGIEPWNARAIEAELRKRGLDPVADNRAGGFESFHVKDPDGWDVQVSNGNARNRRVGPANAKLTEPPPFDSTGWSTVWLDHLSFSVSDYKRSASFYANLLGWKPTYDEGSQHELMIGDVGDVIIRGGNPLSGAFARGGGGARIDHISFGITPWDTDGVKAELERRGLRARVDTSTGDDIHVAAFKSYHTTTPNGYDLQISYVTHDNRLALPNAVRPRAPAAPR